MDWTVHFDSGMTQIECSNTGSEVGSGSGSFYASQIVIGELLCSNTNPRYSANVLRSWRRRRSDSESNFFFLFKVSYFVMCCKQHAQTRNILNQLRKRNRKKVNNARVTFT